MSDRMISCEVLKQFQKWFPGMVAGFLLDDAKVLEAQGLVKIVDEEFLVAKAAQAPAAVQTNDGDGDEIAIPEDWREKHGATLISLAKKIAGDATPSEGADKEWAVSVIEAEEARRAEQKDS